MQRDPFLHGSPVLLIVTHAESDSCALYLMDCQAVALGQSSENSSVAAFHASESIRSSLYSSQQPQGILQTSSVCVGCSPYLPENLPGPLCSSRKAFSACLSASLLFQRSCLMDLDCSSFWWDSIIQVAFSTIFHCGLVCVSAVMELLAWAEWRHNKPKTKNKGRGWCDAPHATSFGGHGRCQILLNTTWLLPMFVQVSPQISVPPLMSSLPSRSWLVLGFYGGLVPLGCFDLPGFHAWAFWLLWLAQPSSAPLLAQIEDLTKLEILV